MNRIKKMFTKLFPYDKLLHFVAGTYIALILSSLTAWWIVLLVVLAIAVGVEAYDKVSGKGNAELLDIIYTLAGCVTVIIINLIKTIAL